MLLLAVIVYYTRRVYRMKERKRKRKRKKKRERGLTRRRTFTGSGHVSPQYKYGLGRNFGDRYTDSRSVSSINPKRETYQYL